MRINVKGGENERTGWEEVVTLEVDDETEDVEVVLRLDLEEVAVVVPITGDRTPEMMPGIKSVVADVADVVFSFTGGVGLAGVG